MSLRYQLYIFSAV